MRGVTGNPPDVLTIIPLGHTTRRVEVVYIVSGRAVSIMGFGGPGVESKGESTASFPRTPSYDLESNLLEGASLNFTFKPRHPAYQLQQLTAVHVTSQSGSRDDREPLREQARDWE